jgi:histone deacetylase complex subunit SAP18
MSILVDREKICPFLLRCFWSLNKNNISSSYRNQFPANQVQIYTWKDATLKELVELLQQELTVTREEDVSIHFSLVYADRSGDNIVKQVGVFTLCI